MGYYHHSGTGGGYLAYEGAVKIYEYLFQKKKDHHVQKAAATDKKEILELEKQKIRSAIITDFILSVEIVIIALGTVIEEPLLTRILVVSVIALVATVGVYGIVALIVRMDDAGYHLIGLNDEDHSFSDKLGHFLVNALPWVIKGLGVVGTLALLLVSGGIFVHNIDFIHDWLHGIPALAAEFLTGMVAGFVVFLIVKGIKKLF